MKSVSVIIPIYNVEKYLRECLLSVLNQSFDDYEVICVNDASTDSSIEILKEYMKTSDKIRLIEHEKNKGLSAARNTGLKEAEGKYVFFLDSDDKIVNNTLEELFFCAEQNRTDIIYFNMTKIWDGALQKPAYYKVPQYREYSGVYNGKELFAAFVENETYKIEVWRQFYRKEFLIENELWFYEGILHEDNLFSFLCAMKACRVMNINKDYYIYRIRENSIMSTKSKKRADSLFIVWIEIFRYWNENILSERINNAIKQYFESIYKGILGYRVWGEGREELKQGSTAERCLYSLIFNSTQKYVTLSYDTIRKIKQEIKQEKRIIVYGAGRAAEDVIHLLHENNISIYGIAVSKAEENSKMFCGIEVNEIMHYCDMHSDSVVVVGITGKYRDGVVERLEELDFKNIIVAEDVQ